MYQQIVSSSVTQNDNQLIDSMTDVDECILKHLGKNFNDVLQSL